MRPVLLVVLALAILLVAPFALADPDEVVAAPEPADAAALQGVVDLEEGQPAPFTGFLLSEPRFLAVADLQVQVDLMAGYLASRDRRLGEAEAELSDARREREPGWWSRHAFVLGVVVGAAAAVALVWAAFQATHPEAGSVPAALEAR